MGLVDVDFIQLDIEGFELRALKGAAETITRSHPVIMVEQKGLGERIGDTDTEVVAWLERMGYCARGVINNDHWYSYD
jgi:hypothetical protein